jgi:hypothetical protein
VSNEPRLAEAGDDAVTLRETTRQYLQMVAQSCGEEYDASWAWNSFGLWIPPQDPAAAFEEMQWIFGDCSPEEPETVEILWKSWYDTAPAWYRMDIMETYADRARPAMRGFWANPATGLVVLADVVAALIATRASGLGPVSACRPVPSPTLRAMSRSAPRRGGRKGQSHRATPGDLRSYSVPPASAVTVTRADGSVEVLPAQPARKATTPRRPKGPPVCAMCGDPITGKVLVRACF